MNLTGLTDAEIWISFKTGEKWAMAYVYSENAETLFRYGLKFTRDSALVEDVLQDLFTDLIKNRKSLGDTDNILFYLLKSFKRKMLRKIQTEKRYDRKEEIEGYHFEVTWSVEHDFILNEFSEQKVKMLSEALQKLTPRQKEAIYLRFTKELDYKEVAGLMDISVEACRNLIAKAISILKKCILEKGQGPAVFFVLFLK
ncbi:MAG: sigma-70 family RNA polymerase sigma factor [Bacteroidota bacterium]|nr:sigma-70 family RNA polymerase sigma factor [Bacteroidota bacterium]MDP3433968.1 sigma-70 family RNA polymerase sigma factor [Bacteroidota bacterium]